MIDWKDKLAAATGYEPSLDVSSISPEESSPLTTPKNQHRLRVSIQRAGRAGKTVTIISGFAGSDIELLALCRLLKLKCGVGGSAKDGDIIIQGDLRQRIVDLLKAEGYTQTK
ncbi:MAG: translation initiation factor [bacterium]|nr:translation initiation factor [Candidatus Minthenecus merdequi]